MIRKSFLIFCVMAVTAVYARGENVLLLPQLQTTAQSNALGNNSGFLQGLNAQGLNPAGLHTSHMEVLTQYQSLLADTNLSLLGAAYPAQKWNTTFSFNYMRLDAGTFVGRDSLGQTNGEFRAEESMIGLGMSRSVAFGGTAPILLGLQLKRFQYRAGTMQSNVLAADFGVQYQLVNQPLVFGLSVLNIGSDLKLGSGTSPLPTRFCFSGAYKFGDSLSVTSGFSHEKENGQNEFSVGAEFSVGSRLALRGGYSHPMKSSMSGWSSMSAGIGIRLSGNHTLDYSVQAFDSSLREAGEQAQQNITLTFRFQ